MSIPPHNMPVTTHRSEVTRESARRWAGPAALCVAILGLACTVFCGCGEKPQSAPPTRGTVPGPASETPPAPSPENPSAPQEALHPALNWGFKFASAIPVKPHLTDRCRVQHEILDAAARLGAPAVAARRAAEIENWRRGVLYADIAGLFAEQGDAARAQEYLRRARAFGDLIEGWQRDRIKAHIATAQIKMTAAEPPVAAAKSLPPEEAIRVDERRLVDAATKDYDKAMRTLGKLAEAKEMEVKHGVARAYVTILKGLDKESDPDGQRVAELTRRVGEIGGKLPPQIQHELLCSLAEAGIAGGRLQMAAEVLRDAEAKMGSGGKLNARFDVAGLTRLCEVWNTIDKMGAGEAKRLLAKADELLEESAIGGNDRVRAAAELARGYAVCGDVERAWQRMRNALNLAAAQTNARPRAMNMARVCIVIARSGLEVPPDVETMLTRTFSELSDPW